MIAQDSLSKNALGGTELMKQRLLDVVPSSVLDKFQIFFSRVEEPFDETKLRILYCHDLPMDPASQILADGGWKAFHKIVFVSNWQMQNYIGHFNIPWSKCVVIKNAIEPLPLHKKPKDGPIRIAYWSTPHRGLELLVPAFSAIAERRDNVVLDIYSSFNLYGWPERDEPFKKVFQECEDHPKINYYGSIPNEELRKNLEESHIFAYPSIWPETSCLCLIEAMSAGLACVHSNLAALPETAMNRTFMYPFKENPNEHATNFATFLDLIIANYWSDSIQNQLELQKIVADETFNLNQFAISWNGLTNQLLYDLDNKIISLEREDKFFVINT